MLSNLLYITPYLCNLIVSTMVISLILLIGRLIAIAADIRHNNTINTKELTGTLQFAPHLSAIRN